SQKPEGGLQHPNGDALTVADHFFANGGGDVYVLLQDVYQQWPYEDLGIEDYLDRLPPVVRQIAAHPRRDRFVLVPFNEPDYIWYQGLDGADEERYRQALDRYLAHWDRVYRLIRSIAPDIRVAGPNTAAYLPGFLRDFHAHALAH